MFGARRKNSAWDLEALEMATRAGLHRAGAAVLTGLLAQPGAHGARVACACGEQAHHHDHRPKRLLTALGPIEFERAYFICPHCHQGYSPRDRELDVEGTECSPGVRRMLALVGSESSFEQGREQLELLAGIEVTAKAVERQAEAIGADIAARMRYPIFRAQGLFVGSGVVEAGCKTVVATRLKRSGMFWTVGGANAIIALRSCRLSGRFEDYWEARSPAA